MLFFLQKLLRLFIAVFYRVTVSGAGNIPASGAGVVCASHQYSLDLILIGAYVPRKIRWRAKSELFRNPLFGALITFIGAFPVSRGAHDREAVKTVRAALANGELLGMFPEGTRVRDTQKRPELKRGFVTFAESVRAPLLPVSIRYGGGPFGPGKLFSRITLTFGEPVSFSPDRKYSREELDGIAESVMSEIYEKIIC
ncbi:MAG: 1-acyl-sn-glycerol-3-phosphate acyltransferase [Clostridiales bacterium]|jgi:1-acyl-sn-glycerol-3-phosphate acyltransferase|nr:1-acyl-sn-glycerol-3-phosphate acyltransferase [Clostridiales bacterium]